MRRLFSKKAEPQEIELFGLSFSSRLGMTSGTDRKAEFFNSLKDWGLSFVEIGPLDCGSLRDAVRKISEQPAKLKIAAYIKSDLLKSFSLCYDFFDFFVVDTTSDSGFDQLSLLLEARLGENSYKPIVARIPGCISTSELRSNMDYFLGSGVDAVEISDLNQIAIIREQSLGKMPIIASSGIESQAQAAQALSQGADLVGVRAGFLFSKAEKSQRIAGAPKSAENAESDTIQNSLPA